MKHRSIISVFLLVSALSARADDVPDSVRAEFKLAPFYTQYLSAGGLPIVASAKVSPFALAEARYLIDHMLVDRDDIRRAMIEAKVRFTVMAATEMTTDVPEHSDLKPKQYWDRRARGLGATTIRPSVSCGEENLLCMKGDPYSRENILIHEFGHAIQEMGLIAVDKTFEGRLKDSYTQAMAAGLWKGSYSATNFHEYWAEGVQAWFDAGRLDPSANSGINTREKLKEYDPRLAKLVEETFGDKPWRYTRADKREQPDHLAGLNRQTLATFVWPAEVAR